jgi:hypothetical protein
VRHEEGRERDHDQVVEKEHPAGQEPERVVERPADKRRRAACLRDRGRPLGVGERDEQEQDADHQQHPGREPEREQREDAEREEDRGRDLPVGDGGQ